MDSSRSPPSKLRQPRFFSPRSKNHPLFSSGSTSSIMQDVLPESLSMEVNVAHLSSTVHFPAACSPILSRESTTLALCEHSHTSSTSLLPSLLRRPLYPSHTFSSSPASLCSLGSHSVPAPESSAALPLASCSTGLTSLLSATSSLSSSSPIIENNVLSTPLASSTSSLELLSLNCSASCTPPTEEVRALNDYVRSLQKDMEALELVNQQLSRKLEAVHGGDLDVRQMIDKLEELPHAREKLLKEKQRRGELLHNYVALRKKLQRGPVEEDNPLEQQKLHFEVAVEALRIKAKENERLWESRIQTAVSENQNLRDCLNAAHVTYKRQIAQAEKKVWDNQRAAEHYRDVLAKRDSAISDLKEQIGASSCVVCWVQTVSSVTSPCMHACLCSECASKLQQCPLCRTPISQLMTIFLRVVA